MSIALTALAAGLAALILTRWMRAVAGTDSAWLRSGLHAVLAAAGGAGAAVLADGWVELVTFAVLALACALLLVIDLAAYRLPDIIVGPMYPVLFLGLAIAAAVSGDWARLGRAATAMLVVTVVYFVLAYVAPSGLGLGDVKLSGLLGAFLGWLGWSQTLLGLLAGFALSALTASILLLATRATRHSEFPFGPWMIAGSVLGAAFGPTVFPGIG